MSSSIQPQLQQSNGFPGWPPAPLQSSLLTALGGVRHGLTRRLEHTGTAEANISFTSPRDKHEAWFMRQSWCSAIGVDAHTLAVPHQVHGGEVAVAYASDAGTGAMPDSGLLARADAVITAVAGVSLMTTHADCLPLLLYAPRARVVAAVHAGWRSTVCSVTTNTLRTMSSVFGVEPGGIVAFMGPAICNDCYEVGDDVCEAWLDLDHHDSAGALAFHSERTTFDLVAANRKMLVDSGVPPSNIEACGICTKCNGAHWFSHRGQGPLTGRFGAIITLDGTS